MEQPSPQVVALLMEQLQEQLEGLPGFGIVQDYWNGYAEEKFNKDPYKDEKTGKTLRLPPEITTKQEQKTWRRIQKQAWVHDKCFLGSCGVGLDCGLGLAPLVSLFFPVLGPLLMFGVHLRLILQANDQIHMPNKLVAKMEAKIGLDLLLTLPPLIGAFFSWLNGCLTSNASTIYGYMITSARERAAGGVATYYDPNVPADARPKNKTTLSNNPFANASRNNPNRGIEVGGQETGYVQTQRY